MTQEPIRALSQALRDQSHWIRLGAARAAPWLAPKAAAELLADRANESSLSVHETTIIAVALANAGGDPISLIAKLLGDTAAAVQNAVDGQYPRWEEYALKRIEVTGLRGLYRLNLLAGFFAAYKRGKQRAQGGKGPPKLDPDKGRASSPLFRFKHWRQIAANFGARGKQRAQGDEAPLKLHPDKGRASSALFWFKHWRKFATNFGEDVSFQAEIDETFRSAIKALKSDETLKAAEHLIEIALSHPVKWMRDLAISTLSPLRTDASPSLLEALAGKPIAIPDERVYASIAEQGWALSNAVSPEELATFFASEALEDFTDVETAFAVVSAAVAWHGAAQARAARVAARMQANVALPPLLWSALYLPSSSERRIANSLLERIVAKDDALNIRYHHIDHEELQPGQLAWLLQIASEKRPERFWMSDSSVCVPVLAQAIAIMPDLVGTVGNYYSDAPTALRVTGFTQSISRLLNTFVSGADYHKTTGTRHPEISFPKYCLVGEEVELKITLLLAPTDTSAPPLKIPFSKGQDHVNLMVAVHAPGFSLPIKQKNILVPRQASSEVVQFHLRAETCGEQAIDIKFMCGTAIVGHCCIVTHVTTHPREGKSDILLLDPVDVDEFLLDEAAQAVLRVSSLSDRRLEWSILQDNRGPQLLGTSSKSFGEQEASGWVEKQGPLIRQMLKEHLSEGDMTSVLAQLSALGHTIFAQIAPPTLAARLNELQENALLVIDSDADWIPWELLASQPAGKLWGERFVVIRAPVTTRPPNVSLARPTQISNTIDHVLLVIGDKIISPSSLAKHIFRSMSQRAEPPIIEGEWSELCARVPGKDIVHFACHGRANPTYHLSYKAGVGGKLLPGQAHALNLKWGAVVFANACSSGSAELFLSDFQNLGREFYYAGARPFIGTLGPIPQREANEFASLFYEQFAFAGLPAGHAMRRAREESAKRFRKPLWLFYCLYGNPSVVRRWATV